VQEDPLKLVDNVLLRLRPWTNQSPQASKVLWALICL
jgi:hypothetical protein